MRRLLIATVLLCVVGMLVVGACQKTDGGKDFTEGEVAEIKALLEGFDSKIYHIVLPTLRDKRIVGSETYGSLPVTEVRKVASALDIRYTENGNLQAIFQNCNGGGAGSHTESQSGAKGADLGRRIEKVLQNLDKSRYVLLVN